MSNIIDFEEERRKRRGWDPLDYDAYYELSDEELAEVIFLEILEDVSLPKPRLELVADNTEAFKRAMKAGLDPEL